MKIHRLAKYFPVLEGEEFDLLVEDIKKNGQRETIKIIGDEILDGVNRYRACRKLDIEPRFEDVSAEDPLAYVVSENIRRRHMTESQKAMLATEMLPEFEEQAKERMRTSKPGGGRETTRTDGRKELARDDAAKHFGVSGPSVQRAKRIKEKAPEKVADIIKGTLTVTGVDKEIRQAEYAAKMKTQKPDNLIEAKGEALIYASKIREVVLILPAKVPKEGWSEDSFAEVQAMVEIIRKRLEAWE